MSDFKINDYNALTDEILNNENFVRLMIPYQSTYQLQKYQRCKLIYS